MGTIHLTPAEIVTALGAEQSRSCVLNAHRNCGARMEIAQPPGVQRCEPPSSGGRHSPASTNNPGLEIWELSALESAACQPCRRVLVLRASQTLNR